MTRTSIALVALSLAVALPGCSRAGRTNTISEAEQRATPNFIEDSRFVNDPGLAKKIDLVELIESEAPGGFRQVQAELFNDTGKFRQVQYAFRWYRQDGMEISSNLSQWRSVGIQPADFARITGTAPSPDAVDFRLAVRRTR